MAQDYFRLYFFTWILRMTVCLLDHHAYPIYREANNWAWPIKGLWVTDNFSLPTALPSNLVKDLKLSLQQLDMAYKRSMDWISIDSPVRL